MIRVLVGMFFVLLFVRLAFPELLGLPAGPIFSRSP